MMSVARVSHALGLKKGLIAGRAKWFMVCVVLLDVALLGANLMFHIYTGSGQDGLLFDIFSWEAWYGEQDGSVIEMVGHVKLLIASIILFVVAKQSGKRVFKLWSGILVVVVLDDFLRLHERAGELLTTMTGPWKFLGMGSQSFGELTFWMAAAVPLGVWLLRSHFDADVPSRRDSLLMVSAMLVLAFFAVGVDVLIAVLGAKFGYIGYQLLNSVETAGELLSMSVVLIAAVVVRTRRSQAYAGGFAD